MSLQVFTFFDISSAFDLNGLCTVAYQSIKHQTKFEKEKTAVDGFSVLSKGKVKKNKNKAIMIIFVSPP